MYFPEFTDVGTSIAVLHGAGRRTPWSWHESAHLHGLAAILALQAVQAQIETETIPLASIPANRRSSTEDQSRLTRMAPKRINQRQTPGRAVSRGTSDRFRIFGRRGPDTPDSGYHRLCLTVGRPSPCGGRPVLRARPLT